MSMRIRTAFVIMLVFVAVTTANYFSSLVFTTTSITETMEQELLLALDIADTVVATNIGLLKSNAETVAERLINNETSEDMKAGMAAQMEEFTDFIALTVYDREGIYANYGIPLAHDVFNDESNYIQATFEGMRILTSPHFNSKSGDLVMHVFVPMDQHRILSATIPGMLFSDLLSQYRLWQSGSFFIIDSEGTFVANYRSDLVLEQRNFIKDAETDPGMKTAGEFYQRMISTRESGTGKYFFEEKERLCVFKYVTNSIVGWRIGVAAPLAESPQYSVKNSLLYAAMLFTAVGFVLSIFISRFAVKPFVRIEAQNRNLEKLNATVQEQATLLLDERERIKVLLDATPLACRLWNKDYRVFECNEATVTLFGLSDRQEFMDHIFDYSPPFQPDGRPSRETTISILKKVFEVGYDSFEWMHQKPDGTLIPSEVTLVRVKYEDDYVIAGYTRDLREHNVMMEAIHRRDELLNIGNSTAESLLSLEDVANIEVSLMQSMELVGRTVDVDRVQIWRNETIDGQLYFVHTYEWLSEVGKLRVPIPFGLRFAYADKPEWERMFMRNECINGPVSNLPIKDQEFLNKYDMKSIAIIPLFLHDEFWGFFSIDDCRVERTFSEDEIRILRSVSLMMASAFNRGDQVAKIREANEYTELLLEAMPFSCNLWDRNNKLFKCNEGSVRMFEISDKSVFLERFDDFSPKYQPDGWLSSEKSAYVLNKAFEEGICVTEWMHQTLDGTPIPCEVTVVRITHSGDYVVAAYVRDLREQKRMLAEIDEMMLNLQTANRAKSDFLAKMSHEMRTPLNAIIGLSELALEDETIEKESRLSIERVNNAGVILLNTVNDILDMSKIEAGKLELNPISYDLPSLLNDTVTQSIMHIEEKPISFILDIDESLPVQLFGDDLRIRQILNNLLSNAFKYTQEGSVELGVHCERASEDKVWMTAQVRDSGVGIKTEHIASLFDEFIKIDEQANRQVMGTGLGLPITKKMVELMNGTITVESEYGKGSLFTVRILQGYVGDDTIGPDVVENLKSFRYSDQKRSINAGMVRVRLPYAHVLVVDDTITNLDVAKGLLKPYDMQVDCVTGGQEAIDAISDETVRYNAIFMDHMMPDIDGVEAVKRIRALDSDYAKNIPIIACTANAILGSNEMFLANGFQAFISKPIDVQKLDEVIRTWIRDKSLETQYFERVVNVNGRAIPDSRTGNERRANAVGGRRSGFDRRALVGLNNVLDVERGIGRFGGDKEVYYDILRSFSVNTKPLLDDISEVRGDSLADYAIIVHGIKGSSRGIYAETIGTQAEALEKAAKRGDLDFVVEYNREFIVSVRKLISSIDVVLKTVEHAEAALYKPVKSKPDRAVINNILLACQKYSMDALESAMAELDNYRYESDGGLVDWLKTTASQYDLSKIAERLNELLDDY